MLTAARIIFTGLVTLIEPQTIDGNSSAAAVFPNAQSAAHFTYIAVSDGFILDGDTEAADRRIAKWVSPLGREYQVLELYGERVVLKELPSGNAFFELKKSSDYKTRFPRNEREAKSLQWIPRMPAAWPRMFPGLKRRALPSFLKEDADPELVAARFELPDQSELSTLWMTTDVWRLAPGRALRTDLRQAVAHEVEAYLRDITDLMTFEVTPLQACKGKPANCIPEPLIFTVKRSANTTPEKPITILMANTPRDDIAPSNSPPFYCGSPEPGFECAVKGVPPCHCADFHFRMYYRMFESQPDDAPVPFMISHGAPLMVTTQRVGGANCGPSGYPNGGK